MHTTAPHTRRARAARRRGFTLVELLVVILVIGLLAAMVAPNIFGHVGTSKSTVARSQIEMLGAALDAYRLDNDTYPTGEQGLGALRRPPVTAPVPLAWRGPYLRKELPLDPWQRPYVYRSPGVADSWGYDLVSYGRDGREGGTGEDADLASWK